MVFGCVFIGKVEAQPIIGNFDFYTFNNGTIGACNAAAAPTPPGFQGIGVYNILNIGFHRPARVIGLNAHGKPMILRFAAETTGCSPVNNGHTMGYAIHNVAGATTGNWPMTIEGLIPGSTVTLEMSAPAFGIMGGTPSPTREYGVMYGGATTVVPSNNGGVLVPVGTEVAGGSTVTAQIIGNPSGGDVEFNIDRVVVMITEPNPLPASPFDFIGLYNFVSDGTGACAQRGETEQGFMDVVVSGSATEMPMVDLGATPCPSLCECRTTGPCIMNAAFCGPVMAFGGCELPNDIAYVSFTAADSPLDFKLNNLPPGTVAELFFAGGVQTANDYTVQYGGTTTTVAGPGLVPVGSDVAGADGMVVATLDDVGGDDGHIGQFTVCLKFPDNCPPSPTDLGCFPSLEAVDMALPESLMPEGELTINVETNAVPGDDCLVLWEREICSDLVITPTFLRTTAFPDDGNIGLLPTVIDPASTANGVINNLNGAGPDGFQYNTVVAPMPTFDYSFTVPSGHIVDCLEVYGVVFTAINEQITSYTATITDAAGGLVFSGSASTPTLLANGDPLDICGLNLAQGTYNIQLTDTDPPNSCKEMSEVQFTSKAVYMQRAKYSIGGPLVASVDDVDLGCIYGLASIPPFAGSEVTASSECSSVINVMHCGDFTDAATSMPFTVLSECTGAVFRCYQVADDCGNATRVVQRIAYRFDREAPKVVCPLGRSLGCNTNNLPSADFVAGAAPLAADLAAVTVTENCMDCPYDISLWCDTYFTNDNDCVVTLDRKIRVEDCCGNVAVCSIVHSIGDAVPTITGVEAGSNLNCQACGTVPLTNLAALAIDVPPNYASGGESTAFMMGTATDVTPYTNQTIFPCAELPLISAAIVAGATSFGSTPMTMMNDPFAYDVCDPKGTTPALRGGGSWIHFVGAAPFEVTHTFTTGTNIFIDIWGRVDGCCLMRDNNFTLTFLLNGAMVHQATAVGILPDTTADTHLRYVVPAGIAADEISISSMVGNFTLQEIRLGTYVEADAGDGALGLSCGMATGNYMATLDLPPGCSGPWQSFGTVLNVPDGASVDVSAGGAAQTVMGPFSGGVSLPVSGAAGLPVMFTLNSPDGCNTPLVLDYAASAVCTQSVDQLLASGAVTIANVFSTNGCDVTVDRTYRVETCCDFFDEETVTFTYTKLPDLVAGPLAKMDLGCIASTNQIPPVDLTMFAASSSCEVVSIQKLGATAPVQVECDWTFTRTFVVETLCDQTVTVDQVVCYTLNTAQPEIVSVEKGTNHGCQAAGFVPPIDQAALVVTNSIVQDIICQTIVLDANDAANQARVFTNGASDGANILFDDGNNVNNSRQQLMWLNFVDELNALPPGISILSAELVWPGTTGGGVFDPSVQIGVFPVPDASLGAPSVYTPPTDGCYLPDYYAANTPIDNISYMDITAGVATWDVSNLLGLWAGGGGPGIQNGQVMILPDRNPNAACSNPTAAGAIWINFTGNPELRIKYRPLATSPLDFVTVTNQVMTNGCEVMYIREFRTEDCCGNFDRREVVHTYTLAPTPAVVSAIAPIDLGCIASTNQIPSPSALLVDASSECSVVDIDWVGDFTTGGLDICPRVQEAESLRLNGAWTTATGNTIPSGGMPSGGTYIVAPNGTGFDAGASGNFAEGDFRVITPGSYQVIVYVRTPNFGAGNTAGNNDSFHFSIDGGPIVTENGMNFQNTFGARNVDTFDLDCGEHTFQIFRREDGTEIDRIEFNLVAARDPVNVCECPEVIARVYTVEDLCGNVSTVTQCIAYATNTAPPRIDAVMAFQDYGCVSTNPRTQAESLAAIVASDVDGNLVNTNLVMEMAIPSGDGCGIVVTRTWRVEDCCGGFDLKDEVYQYTLTPTALVFTVVAPTPVDIGCVSSTNQVPPPTPSLYQANTSASFCPQEPGMILLEAEDTTVRSGVGNATVHAGFTGTGFADYGGAGTFVEFNVPGGSAGGAATATFRFAVGSAGPRSANIIVNGVNQGVATFALTGAWTTWATESYPITLNPGPNTVRVVSINAGPNLDSLFVAFACENPINLDCGATVRWVGDTVVSNNVETCQTFLERVYMATNECGLVAMSTQEIVFAIADPISIVAGDDIDFGCQIGGFLPPIQTNGLVVSGITLSACVDTTPFLGWNASGYAGGAWVPDTGSGNLAAVGGPTTTPLTGAVADFTKSSQAICLAGGSGFTRGGGGFGSVGGDVDTLNSAMSGSMEFCFAPDVLPTATPQLLWEDGGQVDGSGLYLDGCILTLAMRRANAQQEYIDIDLCAAGWSAGQYICATVVFDKAVPGSETATLSVNFSSGLGASSSVTYATGGGWAGTDDATIGFVNGASGGTAVDGSLRGVPLTPFAGKVARVAVFGAAVSPPPAAVTVTDEIVSSNDCLIVLERTFMIEGCCGVTAEDTQIIQWNASNPPPVIVGQDEINLGCITTNGLVMAPASCPNLNGPFGVAVGVGNANGFGLTGVYTDSNFGGGNENIGTDVLGNGVVVTDQLVDNGDGTCDLIITTESLGDELAPAGLAIGGAPADQFALFYGANGGLTPLNYGGGTVVSAVAFILDAGGGFLGAQDLLAFGFNVQSGSFAAPFGAATGIGVDRVLLFITFTAAPVPPTGTPLPGLVPPPDPGQFTVTDGICDSVVTQFMSSSVNQLERYCDFELTRVYRAIDECNQTGLFTQRITWVLDLLPEITDVEPDANLGCQSAGFTPPTNFAAIAGNAGGIPALVEGTFPPTETNSLHETCAMDFMGIFSNTVLSPQMGINTEPEFMWINPAGGAWMATLTGDDPATPNFDPQGGIGTSAVPASVTGFVGSTSAWCFDGVDDELTRVSFENDGVPALQRNPSTFEICFASSNLTHTGVLFETGGTGAGITLVQSNNFLLFHARDNSLGTLLSIDLTPFWTSPSSWVCAVISHNAAGDEISMTVSAPDGSFKTVCGAVNFNATMFGVNPVSIGEVNNNASIDVDTPLMAAASWFTGKVASFRVWNGYQRGLERNDLTCDYTALTGCGGIALTADCISCGVPTNGSYTVTLTPLCDEPIGWLDLTVDTLLNGGAMDVTITDGTTINGPMPVSTNIDLSAFAPLPLTVTFDFIGGANSCESPILLSWSSRVECVFTPTNGPVLTIDDGPVITNFTLGAGSCERAMRRTYRLENCCGNFDQHDVYFTWTERPAFFLDPIPDLNVGCVTSTNLLPQPNTTILTYTAACGLARMDFVGTTNVMIGAFADCSNSLQRVYEIEDICGAITQATQTVTWTLATPPEITDAEVGQDWGCQDLGFSPPDGFFTAMNHITNSISETTVVTDCTATLRRIYRVEDCCGNFDRREVQHTYTARPTPASVAELAPLDVGCIGSTGLVPVASAIIVQVQTAACNIAGITWEGDSVATNLGDCVEQIIRVYTVTDPCGQTTTVTQEITYSVDNGNPTIDAVPAFQDYGCVTENPQPADTNAVVVSDDNLDSVILTWWETTVQNGCDLTVTRTWRAEDCCGNFDLKDEVYAYSLTPELSIETPATVSLGCLNDPAQVPPAVPANVTATADFPPIDDILGASVTVTNITIFGTNDEFAVVSDVFLDIPAIFDHDIDFGPTSVNFAYGVPPQGTTNPATYIVSISLPGTLVIPTLSTNAGTNVILTTLGPNLFAVDVLSAELGSRFDIDFELAPALAQTCPVTVAVIHGGDTVTTNDCEYTVARVYTATDHCGASVSATQTLTFAVDTAEPKFVNNPGGDLGCVGGPPSSADDLAFFGDPANVTDNCGATVTLMGGVPATNGCLRIMTRTYMALDDCGNSVLEDVVYTWTVAPATSPIVASGVTDIGCINTLAQVPSPSPLTITASVECVITQVEHLGDQFTGPLPGQGCAQGMDRIWMVGDLCGITTLHTQQFVFVIRQLPEVTVSPAILQLGCATSEPNPGFTVTATLDGTNAAIAQVVSTETSTNGCDITAVRTWRVENCCGEFDEASATFTWTATPGIPQLVGPARLDLGCINAIGAIPVPSSSQFTPEAGCGARVTLLSETAPVRESNCTNAFTRTYQITDGCGQTNQFVQTLTFLIEDPVQIVSTETGGNFGCAAPVIPPTITNVVLSGNNATSIFATDTVTTNGCITTLTREYLANDCCGNFDRATVVWTWTETPDLPAILGQADVDLGCINDAGQIPVPSTAQLTLDASCGGSIAFTSETDLPADGCTEGVQRVYTATDACGREAVFTQTFTYALTSEPEILIVESGANFGCDGDLSPPADVNAIGAVGNLVSTEVSEVLLTNGCTLTKIRTYRVEDCCGAFDEAEVVFSWQAPDGPMDIDGPDRIDLGCLADRGQIPQPDASLFTASTDCGATITFMGAGTVQAAGCTNSILRTYRATAACGQVMDFVQTITWVDVGQPPEILRTEAGQVFGCSLNSPAPAANPVGLATTGNVVSATVEDVIETNRCDVILTRTYTVADCCGNRDSAEIVFRWQRVPAPPQVNGPATINLGCVPGTGSVPLPATGQFTVDAECGATFVFSRQTDPALGGCLWSMTRTYTATDDCGQVVEFDQLITWSLGAVNPEITAVQEGAHFGCVSTNPVPPVDFSALVVTGDVITQSVSEVTITNGCKRKLTRTYRVQDCCGGFDTRETDFTWSEDIAAPVITPPAGFEPDAGLGCNPTVLVIPPIESGNFSAADDCSDIPVYHAGDAITTNGCAGTLTRRYAATDDCGNTSIITQTVRFVTDTTPPQPSVVPPSIDLGCAPVTIPPPDASVFNVVNMCGDPVSTNLTEETVTNMGCRVVITRTYRIEDDCGNVGMAEQTITYTADSEPPVLQIPGDTDLGCNPAAIPDANPALATAIDGCTGNASADITAVDGAPVVEGCRRTVQRVFIATDVCGNSASATQSVTWVVSEEPPTFTGLPAGGPLGCGGIIPDPDPSLAIASSAGCDDDITVSVAYVITNTLPRCSIEVLHGYRAIDGCGNSTTREIRWTTILNNGTTPTASVMPPGTLPASGADCTVPVPILQVTAEGGCGPDPLRIVQDPAPGTLVEIGTHPITVTVSDGCDNESVETVTLTVTDDNCEEDPGPDLMADVDIEKTIAAGSDAACPGQERVTGMVNMPVTWCFVVRNTGDVRLDSLVINDSAIGVSINVGSLAPGETLIRSQNATLTSAINNTATVTGTPANGTPDVNDSDTAGADIVRPSLAIEKTVAAGANAACPGSEMISAAPGDSITWCFRLTNTGDVALDNLQVMDPLLGGPIAVPGTLQPGASLDHSVTAAFDMPASGMLDNVAMAVADADGLPAIVESVTSPEDGATVVGPIATLTVTTFFDLNSNLMLDENNAGVGGIEVTLTDESGNPTTAVTGPDGTLMFDGLMGGVYTISTNPDTLPEGSSFLGGLENQSIAIPPAGSGELVVPISSTPTAVTLSSFSASETTVSWTVASETETLGYNLLDADGKAINEQLILSGAASYSIDTGSRYGSYALQEVATDLSVVIISRLIVIDAPPVEGAPAITATVGVRDVAPGTNVLIPGATEARLDGVVLNGVMLVTDAGPALYIHVADGGELIAK